MHTLQTFVVPDTTVFQVIEVFSYPEPIWTVLEISDGKVLGGDMHWLSEEWAERARTLYENGCTLHGGHSEYELDRLWALNARALAPVVAVRMADKARTRCIGF